MEHERKYKRHSHCGFCGAPFPEPIDHYWKCGTCERETFINPVPVAVPIIQVGSGLLMVRRKKRSDPGFGKLSFPGGFINGSLLKPGETWREAAAREAREEAGVETDPTRYTVLDAYSVREIGGPILLFCRYDGWFREADLQPFVESDEASERVILVGRYGPTERILTPEQRADIAFTSHTDNAVRYFDEFVYTDDVE